MGVRTGGAGQSAVPAGVVMVPPVMSTDRPVVMVVVAYFFGAPALVTATAASAHTPHTTEMKHVLSMTSTL